MRRLQAKIENFGTKTNFIYPKIKNLTILIPFLCIVILTMLGIKNGNALTRIQLLLLNRKRKHMAIDYEIFEEYHDPCLAAINMNNLKK